MSEESGTALNQTRNVCGFCDEDEFFVYEDDGEVTAIQCSTCGEVFDV